MGINKQYYVADVESITKNMERYAVSIKLGDECKLLTGVDNLLDAFRKVGGETVVFHKVSMSHEEIEIENGSPGAKYVIGVGRNGGVIVVGEEEHVVGEKMAKPRRALVTGGAGFIGSHLCEYLLENGYYVEAFDDMSSGRHENLEECFKSRMFRLEEKSVVDDYGYLGLRVHTMDVVFHLAASVGVQKILEDPWHSIVTNIEGTRNVINACINEGCTLMFASSSEVYGMGEQHLEQRVLQESGERPWDAFAEDDFRVMGPTQDPRWSYAVSKAMGENMCFARRRDGLKFVIARLFNTIGPRQTGRYGMVVPKFIRLALEGKPIPVFGDGRQVRTFGYVKDVVEALESLSKTEEALWEVVNVGGTGKCTIAELAEKVRHMCVSGSEIVWIPYEQAYGVDFMDMQWRVPNLNKLKLTTHLVPETTLEDMLARVIAYESNRVGVSEVLK